MLEQLLEQDLPEGISQTEDELRAIIEQGDVNQCRTLSLHLRAAREGYGQVEPDKAQPVEQGTQQTQGQQTEGAFTEDVQAGEGEETQPGVARMTPEDTSSLLGMQEDAEFDAELIQVTAADLEGRDVVNLRGEEVGEIEGIFQNGGQLYAVIAHGGFLGIGEDQIAIPAERIAVQGDQVVLLGLTEQQLEQMPEYNFETDQEVAGSDVVQIGRYATTGTTAPASGGEQQEAAATRLFSGPEDFPPENFAAYAILASWSDPSDERERFIAICEAYSIILTRSDSVFAPEPGHQLVTVWPVESAELAQDLAGGGPNDERCKIAVDRYDLETAREAMRDAETGSPELRRALAGREGPFLIAWNPSEDKGKSDVPIFRMDLSEVRTQAQAEAFFRLWRQGILDNAENWLDTWHDPDVRMRVRLFLENNAEDATQAISKAAKAMAIFIPGE